MKAIDYRIIEDPYGIFLIGEVFSVDDELSAIYIVHADSFSSREDLANYIQELKYAMTQPVIKYEDVSAYIIDSEY